MSVNFTTDIQKMMNVTFIKTSRRRIIFNIDKLAEFEYKFYNDKQPERDE